jgi:hypothetical protein
MLQRPVVVTVDPGDVEGSNSSTTRTEHKQLYTCRTQTALHVQNTNSSSCAEHKQHYTCRTQTALHVQNTNSSACAEHNQHYTCRTQTALHVQNTNSTTRTEHKQHYTCRTHQFVIGFKNAGSLSSLLHTSSRPKFHAQRQLKLYLLLTHDEVSKRPGHMDYSCLIKLGHYHNWPNCVVCHYWHYMWVPSVP